MSLKYLNTIIPLRRMLALCAVFVVVIETIVVSFVTVTGYITVASVTDFLIRLVHSYLLSYVACVVIAYIDLWIIGCFNRFLPWGKNNAARVLGQLFFVVFVAVFIAVSLTLFAEWTNSYNEPLPQVMLNNILILATANILHTIILELWIALFEKNREMKRREELSLEVSDLKYLVLKSQIDPHFLFNSLNVLSGLIELDSKRALHFIDELAYVYRYVLETIDIKKIEVIREIDFVKSYITLIKIRYGDRVEFEIDEIDEKGLMPPMTLQFAVENAIKHNLATKDNTLRIYISNKSDCIIVSNNMQQKYSKSFSSGIGQENVKNRYRLITETLPSFYEENGMYISKFPIIRAGIDEDHYH